MWSSGNSWQVVWRYESWTAEERSLAQQGESTFFWTLIIAQQAVWSILAIIALFRYEASLLLIITTLLRLHLTWMTLCVLALSLNGSNLLGYTRARLGTSEKMARRATNWILKNILRRQMDPSSTNSA